jgi:hypothetical protein
MISSRRRSGRGKDAVPGCHAGLRVLGESVVLSLCLTFWLTFCLTLWALPAAAQTPTTSRDELMRQWDVDRDGKIDASEAEIARGRMRRARTEAMINSGNDPVTGKPRVPTDPITGRPVPRDATATDRGGLFAPADDDSLILVPGNGERPGATDSGIGGTAGKDSPPRPSQREREALPGTRAPSMSSALPSIAPRLPAGGSSLDPGQRPPGPSSAAGRPGVIAGGARAGVPGARPGYGAATPTRDLNAGRLPGGLPQTRGVAPGTAAGPRLGPMQQPNANAGRLAGPGSSMPRSGIGPYRGSTAQSSPASPLSPASPGAPSVGVPSVPRPGMRQPGGGRPVSATPNTVPRVPRMTTDEFYGR